MIFDDGRQMLRLEVIDTGFFDEDMTFELFGDEGEPDADGIRRVPDVRPSWSARSARWRIRGRTRATSCAPHGRWRNPATRPMTRRAGVRRAGTSTGPRGRWTWAPSAGTVSSTRCPIPIGRPDASARGDA